MFRKDKFFRKNLEKNLSLSATELWRTSRHLNFGRRPPHLDRRHLIYPPEEEASVTVPPCIAMRHVPLLYGCAIPHASALEVLSSDAPPPLASSAIDDPFQPPASLLRCLQQCFSNDFVFDNHVFLGFLPIFLDSFEICQIKKCFVVFGTKIHLGGVFRGEVVLFLARSYFSGIFWIFKGLFELDMLL